MQQKLLALIASVTNELYGLDIEPEISRPEVRYGDFSTNIALKISKQLHQPPLILAKNLAEKLESNDFLSEVSVASPGFINFRLSISSMVDQAREPLGKSLEGKVIVAEYSDPNPFKILHAGHLYTSIIGEAIANLMEAAGANVHRVNFGGDVGLHVAKTMWSIISELGGEKPSELDNVEEGKRSDWLSKCYVSGSQAYEDGDQSLKEQIKDLNKRIYDIALNHDHQSPLGQIYWITRGWSYDYLEAFYKRLNIKFEKYYPESEVADIGVRTVRENIPDVYQESQGAIVFEGQKYGLYTNVFINNQGLPTYAGKDVGLIMKKWDDYHYDKSVMITGNEIAAYMQVVLKSVSLFAPEKVGPIVHLTHGIVKLAGGQKMSSREGNILKATDILDLTAEATEEKGLKSDLRVTTGAVKYSFLKQRIGGDIIYDPNESVSIEGNSGPYLQYSYARARSIINKSSIEDFDLYSVESLDDYERSLLYNIGAFNEALETAISELKPHHLANFLYELAQVFNRFYENSRVIGDPREGLRLSIIRLFGDKIELGLKLLGIEVIEGM